MMTSGIQIHPTCPIDHAAVSALRGLPTSVISDVMGRLGGTVGLAPIDKTSALVCGSALTVKVRAGDNLVLHKALELIEPGHVLVVDGEGDTTRALMGEIMLTLAMARGALGLVIYGAIRDVHAFEEQRFPCWARGVCLRGPYKDGPGSINAPVTVGGLAVAPGDIVVGDQDGVVAVAPSQARLIQSLAHQKIAAETKTLAEIRAGTYSAAWVDDRLKNTQGV